MKQKHRTVSRELAKCPTGIKGLDEITSGGLPLGRPTLVTGGAGCGKTVMGMEFLVRGILDYNEPAAFIAFEEGTKELVENFKSLGFDLENMVAQNKLILDHIEINRAEIIETGEFDLEGLFIRLGGIVDSIGAKRVVLDTLETLFSGFGNEFIVRAELQRLFAWLKQKGLTAIITAERGKEGSLTRHGIEEYVSDCVIVLDNRMQEQISTRRLRVLKYRGSSHGSNEYPFLIDEDGISVLPVTSLGLNYSISTERVPTGIAGLDAMFEGKGYFKGSSVLVSGTAGTGKSSMASSFVNGLCHKGTKCLFVAMEESYDQIIRNMRSIGMDLNKCVEKGSLQFYTARPTVFGLEMHLAMMHKLIIKYKPEVVIVDPISSFLTGGMGQDIKSMLTRLIDFCKSRLITTLFTDLTSAANISLERTQEGISSLIDTWILLRDVELNGERNRLINVLKSRGMSHSNQVREFRITSSGIELSDVYIGPGIVLTGSARVQQEARDRVESLTREQEIKSKQRELEGNRKSTQAQITALEAQLAALSDQEKVLQSQETARREAENLAKERLTSSRISKDVQLVSPNKRKRTGAKK